MYLDERKTPCFSRQRHAPFDELGVTFEREVEPGEILVTGEKGVYSLYTKVDEKPAVCSFEYVYHSRPDSVLGGLEVFKAREEMGREMARQAPVDADAVVWVPDSGLAAAEGYAHEMQMPLVDAFIKNKYFGNNLVKPDDEMFLRGINMKLSVISGNVRGKRVAVVDDSMIQGTTAKIFVAAFEKCGATEVHLRICAPMVKHQCMYGASAPDRQMGGHILSEETICKNTGADSVKFLSIEGLKKACGGADKGFCCACFDGNYPV